MILAALVLAATAELAVVEVTPSKTTLAYDETFSFTARIRNAGPDAAQGLRVLLGGNASTFLLSAQAPPGWLCESTPRYALAMSCEAETLAAGADARFTLTLTAPQPAANTYRVGASVSAASVDPQRTNNTFEQVIGLASPARTAALRITATAAANPVAEGGEIAVRYDVSNAGPDAAREVLVVIEAGPSFTASGSGWSCGGNVCTRAELAAGVTAPIEVRATAPPNEQVLNFAAFVRAEQVFDNDRRDNEARISIGVGNAGSWERILIPVADGAVPGAGGALWTTELSALILADERPEFAPRPCEFVSILCHYGEAPLRRQIDAFEYLVLPVSPAGQYFYVRPQDASKWRFNARISDAARAEQTAGAEIPIVRQSGFVNGTIALLNVPVAPEYRHTLRIYDGDGRERVLAAIRVYAPGETEPRVNVVRELVRVRDHNSVTTTARLPTHPAYAQLDPAQLGSLGDLQSMRIEVEPLDPTARLWAFVSIVNNTTHHVTVVTPQ